MWTHFWRQMWACDDGRGSQVAFWRQTRVIAHSNRSHIIAYINRTPLVAHIFGAKSISLMDLRLDNLKSCRQTRWQLRPSQFFAPNNLATPAEPFNRRQRTVREVVRAVWRQKVRRPKFDNELLNGGHQSAVLAECLAPKT